MATTPHEPSLLFGVVHEEDPERAEKHREKANGVARPKDPFGKALQWLVIKVGILDYEAIDKDALIEFSGISSSYVGSLLTELCYQKALERQRAGKQYHYPATHKLNRISAIAIDKATKARLLGKGEKVDDGKPLPTSGHADNLTMTVTPMLEFFKKEDNQPAPVPAPPGEAQLLPEDACEPRERLSDEDLAEKFENWLHVGDSDVEGAKEFIDNSRKELTYVERGIDWDRVTEDLDHAIDLVDKLSSSPAPDTDTDTPEPEVGRLLAEEVGQQWERILLARSDADPALTILTTPEPTPARPKTYGFLYNGALFWVEEGKEECIRQASAYLQKSANLAEVELVMRVGRIVNVPTLEEL